MLGKKFLLTVVTLLGPLLAAAADVANWEGPHIDAAVDNRAIDWWYTQVISQKAASNGVPPSIEIVLKRGNTFQFGTSNSPLYLVEVNGFDLDGLPFAQTLVFNTSTVAATGNGLETKGTWGNNEVGFIASKDLKKFTVTLNTAIVSGTIVINSESSFRTGCGGAKVTDSPFFDKLVSDGRPLTAAENILYKKTGWRITVPAGPSTVDVTFGGKKIKFSGAGYKDSNWGPNAMNDFIKSWYVLIAEVGPWSFVTFSGATIDGTNNINSGHISYNGQFISSQCNVIGERAKDISIITPSGEATEAGVVVPTEFDVTFVLPDNKKVAFHATNIDSNPSVSVYHRWVANYTGGAVGEKQYKSFGITEWMNPSRTPHWPTIP